MINCEYNFAPELGIIINDETFVPMSLGNVLDVGCATGIFGCLIKTFRNVTSLTGIEIHQPYIDKCLKLKAYDLMIKRNLNNPLPFGENRFDNIFCFSVVEHLKKDKAIELINEMKRISKKVVITTSNGFHYQPALDNNPYQKHLCSIGIKEFQNMNFKVRGMHTIKKTNYYNWKIASLIPSIHTNIIALYEAV